MMVLGLDTATPATVAAVWSATGDVAVELRDDPDQQSKPRHTTKLLSLTVEALARAGVGWPEIDRIVVGVGPGTFTGLRIGIATALALARARDIPLVGVSTLESLALGAAGAAEAASAHESVIAAIDARRGEVFAAGWRLTRGGGLAERTLLPGALAPEALARSLGEHPATLVLGNGAVKFREILERSGASIPGDESRLHEVSALYHCRLALGTPPGPPELVRPEYLRLPDAEIALRIAGTT
jgi:tRNA threonylcarbamoyladenosine biosynthesis protein TsaB